VSKILITGGSGFIGTNLVEHYRNLGDEVLNIDLAAPRNSAHSGNWQKTDILDNAKLEQIVTEFSPDVIFHMAARTDLNGTDVRGYAANTDGVRNLVMAARGVSGLRRIVFASSMLVCKLGYQPTDENDCNPRTYYGESKVIGEQIVRHEAGSSLPWTIVRPTSIWGPWFDAPYKNFFDAIRKGLYFHPAGVRVERSYGYVLNSVYQLGMLAESDRHIVQSKTFYLADYEPLDLRQWAQVIQQTMQVSPIRDAPLFVFKCAAIVGDLLKRMGMSSVPMTTFRLNNMRTDVVFDMEHLARICGVLPHDTVSGVQATVEWMNRCATSDSSN